MKSKGKTIIIYKSKYGSTQEYAQWLAEELGCLAFDIAAGKKLVLGEYDTIILGGGLYAGGISGSSIITNNWLTLKEKSIVVFTVGLANPDNTDYQSIIDKNFNTEQKEKIKFFHLWGGMDYKKLGFIHKSMMAMLVSETRKKNESELTDEDKMMLETYGGIVDFTDRTTLKPIIEYIENLS